MCDYQEFSMVRLNRFRRSLPYIIQDEKQINNMAVQLSQNSLFGKKRRVVNMLKELLVHVRILEAMREAGPDRNRQKMVNAARKISENKPILEEALIKISYDKVIIDTLLQEPVMQKDSPYVYYARRKFEKVRNQLVLTEKELWAIQKQFI